MAQIIHADARHIITERKRSFDAVAMEVFNSRLLSITEDMAINMMRSSFSSQIKERHDFSVGLFDSQGRLIAQGTHIPVHLGSLMGSMQAVLAAVPATEMRSGDAFICNDPYLAGGTHLPDIAIVSPVFYGERLVMFTACIGHHADVGGLVPGSTSARAKSIFEEGIRIPVVQIARAGEIDSLLLNLIASNSRLPEERQLDLRAQIATNERGGVAIRTLIERMGLDAVEAATDDLLFYTEGRLRQRIKELPEGTYSFTTWLDDDGLEGDPVAIKANVTVENDHVSIDMTGTGKQARGGINVPRSALLATAYYCVKALLDKGLSVNSGMFTPISVSAPAGTIANPRQPAACSARTIACQKIAGAIFGALRDALPSERVLASSNDVLPAISFSGSRPDGSYYVFGESLGGGAGARVDADGMDGVHVHITNTLNMPTEALENEFPLLVEEYSLVSDSGGVGKFRGGLGIARQVRAIVDNTVFSGRSDSHKRGAEGVNGGGFGGCGRFVKNAGTATESELGSKVSGLVLMAGETVRIETPGGGGFGLPQERLLANLSRDLRDDVISVGRATTEYGAALTQEALQSCVAEPVSHLSSYL